MSGSGGHIATGCCEQGTCAHTFVASSYCHSGPERVGDHGAGDAGPPGCGQQHRAATAIALYEQHAEHRPPGWPHVGAAALCVLAALGRADTLEGDIARLLVLAKDMRACTIANDPERRARMTGRAMARATDAGPAVVRSSRPARWETIEQRRRRLRDELLLAGDDPVHMDHRRDN